MARTWSPKDNVSISKNIRLKPLLDSGDVKHLWINFNSRCQFDLTLLNLILLDENAKNNELVGRLLDEKVVKDVPFTIGSSNTCDFTFCLDCCLRTMSNKDLDEFTIDIKDKFQMVVEIHLKDVVYSDDFNYWPVRKVVEEVDCVNNAALALFKEGEILLAFQKFKFIFSLLSISFKEFMERENNDEDSLQLRRMMTLRSKSLSNIAACHLKWQNYRFVIDISSKLLNNEEGFEIEDSLLVKQHFRRGVAYLHRQEFVLCRSDLNMVKKLDPQNKRNSDYIFFLNKKEREFNAQLAHNLSKMFAS